MRPRAWRHLNPRGHLASQALQGLRRGLHWRPSAHHRHPTRPRALLLSLALLLAACGGASSQVRRPAPTATHQPSVIYVALGASDAVGTGATNPNTQGYVPRLIARLP